MHPLKKLFPAGRRPRRILTGIFRGLRLQLDLRGGDLQIWAGLYEKEIFSELRRLALGCRSAIDLGAAKGDMTVWLLQQPAIERVVAAEPLVRERIQLETNLALNNFQNDSRLRVHPGFAGSGQGTEWQTLDELGHNMPAPIFIKIDIDGPEAEVLDTGPATLVSECRLLIETHSPEAETGCIERLQHLGYQTKIIYPAWWRRFIPELRPIAHNRWLSAWR